MKNGLACKNKWGTISKEFKEIFDYMLRTKDNEFVARFFNKNTYMI
jgi:hypothetical protein